MMLREQTIYIDAHQDPNYRHFFQVRSEREPTGGAQISD